MPERGEGPVNAHKRLWIPNIAVRVVDQSELKDANPTCIWKLVRECRKELVAAGLLPRNAPIPKILSRADHFDTKEAKFYRLNEHEYIWQGRRYTGYSFERLSGFDESLKLDMGIINRLHERIERLTAQGKPIEGLDYGKEYHEPLHEQGADGPRRINPCNRKDHIELLVRRIYAIASHAEVGVPEEVLDITGHFGYIRWGYKEKDEHGEMIGVNIVNERMAWQEAVWNQLTLNALFREVGEVLVALNPSNEYPNYTYSWEINHGPSKLSITMCDSFAALVTLMEGGLVAPDLEQWRLNNSLRNLTEEELGKLPGYAKQLMDWLTPDRQQKLAEHIELVANYLKNEQGFEDERGRCMIKLNLEQLVGDVEKLLTVSFKEEGREKGFPVFLHGLKTVRAHVNRPIIGPAVKVAHIVSTDKTQCDLKHFSPIERLRVYSSGGIPYRHGEVPGVDRILAAILEENPRALLVNEAPAATLKDAVKECLLLYHELQQHFYL
ncbi:Uncharacterised protein [Candidatus Burarchaeum australiense]|nr:Uncharacterised protein [Candidatus Burarchaeum australiense]